MAKPQVFKKWDGKGGQYKANSWDNCANKGLGEFGHGEEQNNNNVC